MHVTVKFFASYREVVGSKAAQFRLAEGATVRELVDSVYARHPRLREFDDTMILAVNQAVARPDVVLQDGDEIALLPPVSGGLR